MNEISFYNKFLKDEVYEIPLPFVGMTESAKVKFRFIGTREYTSIGEKKEYLLYKIKLLPTGLVNRYVNLVLRGQKRHIIHTHDTSFHRLTHHCDRILEKEFLSAFGEKRPVMCVELENVYEDNMNESIIYESKHDTLVTDIVKDIMVHLKKFSNSELDEDEINLPEEGDYYHTPFIMGESFPFYIELFLFKTNDKKYKIDADSPISLDEDNISIAIYFNPENLKSQLSEIKNNLIYTVRHEYEHVLQTIYDYENVNYDKKHNFRKDSLKTLLKRQEIEPQLRGYYLQSKKERKPFDLVIGSHLDKLEENGQINFLGPERKQIVIDVLVDYAKSIKLPIKLSNG